MIDYDFILNRQKVDTKAETKNLIKYPMLIKSDFWATNSSSGLQHHTNRRRVCRYQMRHSNRCQFITSQPPPHRSRDPLAARQDESLHVPPGDSRDLFGAEARLGFNRSLRDHNCSPFAFSLHLADPWPPLSRAAWSHRWVWCIMGD